MEKTKRASTGRESDKYIVRFPDGMRDKIADVAKTNGRSMNAEIVHRLESSFSETNFKSIPEIFITVDMSDAPVTWDGVHEVLQAIRKHTKLDAVELSVKIITPKLISSREHPEVEDLVRKKLAKKATPIK